MRSIHRGMIPTAATDQTDRSASNIPQSFLLKSGEDKPLHLERPAGGRVTQKQSFVRAPGIRPVGCKFIILSDFILDGTVQIWESRAKQGDQAL